MTTDAWAGGGPETVQGTAIAYQGELKNNGALFTGTAEFRFRLYDAATGGAQVGPTVSFEAGNAVAIASGAVNLPLDFGASPFTGQARWLEVDVRTGLGPFITLTPRQAIGATPYALYALQGTGVALPWIATTSATGLGLLQINNSHPSGAGIYASGNVYGMFGGNTGIGNYGKLGTSFYGVEGQNNTVNSGAGVLGKHIASGNFGELGDFVRGVRGYAVVANGLGVQGEHAPSGNNGALGTADYGVFGHAVATTSFGVYGENAATGTNGRLGDGVAGVDGLALIDNGRPGVRGYHGPTGNYGSLGISTSGVFGYSAVGGLNRAGVRGVNTSGDYGELGTSCTAGHCGLVASSSNVGAHFEGTTTTGIAANFQIQDDGIFAAFIRAPASVIGSITSIGDTVSYNQFTGSHLAWTDTPIDRGMLVEMTGDNRMETAELVYGIAPSSTANSPRCMGAYLGIQEPSRPIGRANHHLVMAVGNGDMWVVQSGNGNIQPGDYLISSEVAGCAMQDDPIGFPIGYIIARAGEAVDWSSMESPTDGSPRRKKISVLFESFVRDSRGAALASIVEQQQRRIEELEAQQRLTNEAEINRLNVQLNSAQSQIEMLREELAALQRLVRERGAP